MGGCMSSGKYLGTCPSGKKRNSHGRAVALKTNASRRLALALTLLLPSRARSWNSFATQSQLYTFQEFYSDAQYGPDFGYYSTGQILHADGPADNGATEADAEGAAGQDWFNSYTTLPMSISPDFAHALCDRIASMWQALGHPDPFVLVEFGGGTGMLARDILRRSRDAHAAFYNALAKYVIAERSPALRGAQSHTTAEFRVAGKLEVASVDAREAALLRPKLDEIMGGRPVVGMILSNELLDEMDPVRLRFMWRRGQVPSVRNSADCRHFREAYVIHRIDTTAIDILLQSDIAGKVVLDSGTTAQSISWEGKSLLCGLLNTPQLARAIEAVAEDLSPVDRAWCSPMLVCCLPFVLAVNQALMYSDTALEASQVYHRENDGNTELGRLYKHHLHRTNGTALLPKNRYRDLRRLAAKLGPEVEHAFLIGDGSSVLPGRVHSEEVFLALSPSRCRELKGWMTRNAERLAATAHLHDRVAWIYDGDSSNSRSSMHLKMVARPGESQYVEQSSQLLDNGFMITIDYGADADALAWHSIIRPNFEGILVMDARRELAELCAHFSYLECPGLQDLTTSVDFTELAQAGKLLGGWSVQAYGPIFLLELSFSEAFPEKSPLDDPLGLGHLLERAGGLHTTGLQGWYLKPEQDPWASFKLLVQHRGETGSHWSIGPLGKEWTRQLSGAPRLFHSPSPCWDLDLTKPPLSAKIVAGARELSQGALIGNIHDVEEALRDNDVTNKNIVVQSFEDILLGSSKPVDSILNIQHQAQKQQYADVHLALILMDYLQVLITHEECEFPIDDLLISEVRDIASSRRLPELYGEEDFSRVFLNVSESLFNLDILSGASSYPPYVCLAVRSFHSHCQILTDHHVNVSSVSATYHDMHVPSAENGASILGMETHDQENSVLAIRDAGENRSSSTVEGFSDMSASERIDTGLGRTVQANEAHVATRLSL